MTPILQTHQLAIGYTTPRRPAIRIVENLNLSLSRGQLICLLGPNGVGKSTLMRTLAGMQKPLAGCVTLSGEELTDFTPRQLATQLSMVLTERSNLGLLNGYALVALGRYPHTNWRGELSRRDETVVRWAIEAVGATHLAGRPVMQLSDGERQKFMIARALAQESQIILLDEPTAFLDLPRRVEIMRLLRHLAHETGRAILLSTHDLDLALRSADVIWLLSQGEIATGAPEDLLLQGTFEAAFAGDGVLFDPHTGSFRVGEHATHTVVLSGDSLHHTWTRRALERAGYVVASAHPHPIAEISLQFDGDNACWRLDAESHTSQHTSLGDLLTALRHLKEETATFQSV